MPTHRDKGASDKPFLMATRCPGVVVAVGADRNQLGLWVLAQQAVDCFVLDDGFQHLNLDRDVNLLLIDVSDFKGMQALVPIGRQPRRHQGNGSPLKTVRHRILLAQ